MGMSNTGISRLSAAQQRRVPAVGRARALGLHLVPGVVLAHMTGAQDPGVWMVGGTALLEVWGGDPQDIQREVSARSPGRLMIVTVVREPTRWTHWTAWWRRLWSTT